MRLTLILALILILVVTIFAVQNNTSIAITLLFWEVNGSLALVLVITLIFGVVIGLLVMAPGNLRRRAQMSKLRKDLQALESDLEQARSSLAAQPEEKVRQDIEAKEDTTSSSKPAEDEDPEVSVG